MCALSLKVSAARAEEEPRQAQERAAGEFFGIPVPLENYYFIEGVLAVFGNRQGREFKDEAERQAYIWDQLLLSFEAFRRDIQVSREEIEAEVDKVLAQEKVTFDRKKEPDSYAAWVKERVGEPVELFENQIRHLLQIEKLRRQVREEINPEVSDQEMFQEFLNEHNTLSVELAEFDSVEQAQEFYRRAKKSRAAWEREKAKRPGSFRRPGFVSLEFLIDIWKIPKEAAYAMMRFAVGEIHPPAPIYKGYAVFKVLEKRPADEKEYGKLKDSYYNQIRERKQFIGYDEWFKKLKEQAHIKIYKEQGGEEK